MRTNEEIVEASYELPGVIARKLLIAKLLECRTLLYEARYEINAIDGE